MQGLPWEAGLSTAPFLSWGFHGDTGKTCSWGLCLWVLGWRGASSPRPGLRGPREAVGVGGLGRAHREWGPGEVLLLPLPNGPWQHATLVHPSQPLHRSGVGGAGRKAMQLGWFREGA